MHVGASPSWRTPEYPAHVKRVCVVCVYVMTHTLPITLLLQSALRLSLRCHMLNRHPQDNRSGSEYPSHAVSQHELF
jgi:hypothetical protein